jgi:glycosyltransferase involved in cell wall biosynthesis
MPLISIVIPLYNKDFIIKATLKSVLAQTFSDYEVIVIDDGSTDNSLKIVTEYIDKRITVYQQENKGSSSARNLGIEKANGELIAFLDADDYWYPNHLEEIFKLYQDFPNCGIYGSRYFIKTTKLKAFKTNYYPSAQNNFRGILPDYFSASKSYRVGLTSAIAIPKNILDGKFLFNTQTTCVEDLELFTKIAIEKSVAVTNFFTVEYNFSLDGQISKTPINQKKLMDFSQFSNDEKQNKNLREFLDIYRMEYGLHYRIIGDIEKSNFYLQSISSKKPIKTAILLKCPVFILKILLKIKHLLKKTGINFSIYH